MDVQKPLEKEGREHESRIADGGTSSLFGLSFLSVGGVFMFISFYLPYVYWNRSLVPISPSELLINPIIVLFTPHSFGLLVAFTSVSILLKHKVSRLVFLNSLSMLTIPIILFVGFHIHADLLVVDALGNFFGLSILVLIWWISSIHLILPFLSGGVCEWSFSRLSWVFGLVCALAGLLLTSSARVRATFGLYIWMFSSILIVLGGFLVELAFSKGKWNVMRNVKIILIGSIPGILLSSFVYFSVIPDTLETLADELKSSEHWKAANAAGAFGSWHSLAEPYVSDLLHALKHPEQSVRGNALRSLAKIGKPKRLIINAIRRGLGKSRSDSQFDALIALRAFGKKGVVLKKEVVKFLQHPKAYHRSVAAQVLCGIGMTQSDIIGITKVQFRNELRKKLQEYSGRAVCK